MRLLVDINHPAHVHYSKYIIKDLVQRKHEVIVTARNRPPNFELLRSENIPFIDRGKGSNSMWGKAWYFIRGDYELLKAALNFKPDIFLCFMSPYAAQVSKLMGKPCVVVDEDFNVSTYKKHILTIEHNVLEGDFLCCGACGMND